MLRTSKEQETSRVYTFGPFGIHGSERLFTRDGNPEPLPPKAFDLLLVLVENHGHILSKDELMRHVWADTFVEEANLTVNISALRKVLGEGRGKARYIETVPKHGYRFVAEVREAPAQHALVDDSHENLLAGTSSLTAASPAGSLADVTLDLQPDPGTRKDELTSAIPSGSTFAGRYKRAGTAAVILAAVFIVGLIGLSRWINSRQPLTLENPTSSPIQSIAVLPFENGAQDTNAEYLSDGISESLINRFSQLSGLKVASWSSSFRYKNKDQDIVKVGTELKVNSVLTGSVKQIGDDLVISVRLDDARTNQHIWGEQYVRKLKDVLSVQNEIAQEVTSNLRLKLSGADEQKLAKKYTQNTEAYQLYLKGNYEWNKHTQVDTQKAIEYYNQALEIDPNYASAYAGLSQSYGFLGNVYMPPNENFPKAKAYAAKALALDETLAHAHGAMGAVRLFYDWDWAEQEKEFKRAQELEPGNGDAHQLYAAYLETAGRFDEALLEAKKAEDIDPLSAMFASEVAITQYFARQYDDAITQFEKTLNLEPHYADAYQYLGQAYEQKKMYAQAIATYQNGISQTERSPALISSLGHAYALSGDRNGAARSVAELRELSKQRYVSPYWTAVVYAGLGNKDEAFAWLEKAFQDRASLLIWLKVEPQFDPLRTDPRFDDLLARIGLNK